MKQIKWTFIVFILITYCLIVSCNSLNQVFKRHHSQYDWWSKYDQGIRLSDSKQWKKAEKCFKSAIEERFDDRIHAATYGRHYINYLPHRELGCTYFHQKQYQKAIDELLISLSFEHTAKSEFYLDQSRIMMLKLNQEDEKKPDINIHFPNELHYINQPEIVIKGTATDDTFVRYIRINNQPYPVFVSKKKVNFRKSLFLKAEKNDIFIQARDVMGNSNKKLIIVYFDNVSPAISLDHPVIKYSGNQKQVKFNLFAYDNYGIQKININRLTYNYQGEKSIHIDLSLTLKGDQYVIPVEVFDISGNSFKEHIRINETVERKKLYLASMNNLQTLLPEYKLYTGSNNSYGSYTVGDRNKSSIMCNDIPDVVFDTPLPVKCTVRDKDGIKKIFLNEESQIENSTDISNRKMCKFNFIPYCIKENNNVFILRVIDSLDNESRKEIKIKKITPSIYTDNYRAAIRIGSIQTKNYFTEANSWEQIFKKLLKKQIDQCKRFKLASSNHQADYSLIGHLDIRKNDLDVNLHFINAQSENIISRVSSFISLKHEYNKKLNIDPKAKNIDSFIILITQDIVDKLCFNHPVIEGNIVKRQKRIILNNLAEEERIEKGQCAYIFKKFIKKDYRILGEAEFIRFDNIKSSAHIIKENRAGSIQAGHYIITK